MFINCITSEFFPLEKAELLYRMINYTCFCLVRSHSKLNLTLGRRRIASLGRNQAGKPCQLSPSILSVSFFSFVICSGNNGTIFLRFTPHLCRFMTDTKALNSSIHPIPGNPRVLRPHLGWWLTSGRPPGRWEQLSPDAWANSLPTSELQM